MAVGGVVAFPWGKLASMRVRRAVVRLRTVLRGASTSARRSRRGLAHRYTYTSYVRFAHAVHRRSLCSLLQRSMRGRRTSVAPEAVLFGPAAPRIPTLSPRFATRLARPGVHVHVV